MRKRPHYKLMGTKVQKPRPRKPGTQNAGINVRKAEIEMRTQRGESAEQIAAALQAQGHELKRGASTITVRFSNANPRDAEGLTKRRDCKQCMASFHLMKPVLEAVGSLRAQNLA